MVTLVSKLRKLQKTDLAEADLEREHRAVISGYGNNPIVTDARSGNPRAFLEYIVDLNEREWTHFRSLLPHKRSKKYNQDVKAVQEIFKSAEGFQTEGLTANDNPLGPAAMYTTTVGLVWSGLEYFMGKDVEHISMYMATATVIAVLAGLIQGGINAYKKLEKRDRTFKNAIWLYTIFKNLYGEKEPLITKLENLDAEMEPGGTLDEAMKTQIDAHQANVVFERSNVPKYIKKFVQQLWEEKWEYPTFFPRLSGAIWPRRKDSDYNVKLREASEVFPHAVEGFRTEGLLASDSPVSASLRYGITVMALGNGIQYAILDMDPNTSQIYTELVKFISSISMLVGLYRGIKSAREKYQFRIETTRQAEWLSQICDRMYNTTK